MMFTRRLAGEIGLTVLVLLAIALRLQPVLFEPSAVWGDEIFQTVEPAHRLVFGTGLVPWEFQFGMRSWLLPGVTAGLMELSRILGNGPGYYLPLISIFFATLAAVPVICCFLWCRRLFGVAGALLSAVAVAVAAEPVYFGARTLSEVVAAHLLVGALYVLEPGFRVTSGRRLFAGGALLALAFVIRVQLAPALAIVALWTSWRGGRRQMVPIVGGAAVVLVAAALLDTLTLGYPLASVWRYVDYNLFNGVSSAFGVEPWSYYLIGEIGVWGGAGATILLLSAIGVGRLPLLAVLAAVILALHSGIAHKEYRFIYPAILLITVLAGVGLAQIAGWASEWLSRHGLTAKLAALAGTGFAMVWWCVASFQIWTGGTLTEHRHRMHDNLAAASFVERSLAPCGIGLYGLGGTDWVVYGGYTYFHWSKPMYWPKDEARLAAMADGFDTLLYTSPPPPALGFTPLRCIGSVCIARRAGGCRPMPTETLPVPEGLTERTNAGPDGGVKAASRQ